MLVNIDALVFLRGVVWIGILIVSSASGAKSIKATTLVYFSFLKCTTPFLQQPFDTLWGNHLFEEPDVVYHWVCFGCSSNFIESLLLHYQCLQCVSSIKIMQLLLPFDYVTYVGMQSRLSSLVESSVLLCTCGNPGACPSWIPSTACHSGPFIVSSEPSVRKLVCHSASRLGHLSAGDKWSSWHVLRATCSWTPLWGQRRIPCHCLTGM